MWLLVRVFPHFQSFPVSANLEGDRVYPGGRAAFCRPLVILFQHQNSPVVQMLMVTKGNLLGHLFIYSRGGTVNIEITK